LWQRLLESDLHNHMERALDACVRSTIEAWNGRERAFQERAEARDAAIARALHTMWARLEAQRQPLLFADIAADPAARQPTHRRASPPGGRPMSSDASLGRSAVSSGPSAEVEHTLLLMLVLR